MIDEESAVNFRTRMDFDSGEEPGHLREEAREESQTYVVEWMAN
jgi:hypothetical protein